MQIKLNNVTKRYQNTVALEKTTLALPDDQIVAILGPSGAGKSTLLRLLGGLEKPSGGQIFLNNHEMPQDESLLIEHRKKVGYVFQSFNLFPHLSAMDNITLPLIYAKHYTKEEAKKLATSLLTRFHLQEDASKKPAELSGGQKQRVAILRAIAINPDMLLFDEPTSALDPIMTAEVLALIAELKQEQGHFIIATHHVHFAKRIADFIIFMAEGKVLEHAPTEEFFANPKTLEAKNYLEKVLIYW